MMIDDSKRIAKVFRHGGDFLIDFNANDAERAHQIFLGVGEGSNLVHFVRRLDHRNVKRELFLAAQNFQMHSGAGIDGHQPKGNVRNAIGRATIDGEQDISNAHSHG